MANEVQVQYGFTGVTVYYVFRNQTSGFIWSTSGGTGGYESFISGNWSSYAISMTEQGVQGYYMASIPAATPAGVLAVTAKQQLTGSPLQTDPNAGVGDIQWNGSITVPLSNLATSGQIGQAFPIRLARGTMIQNFPIYLKSSVDHVTPFTSGQVSGQIWRDGSAVPTALQSGAFTEIGNGFYKVQALTSGDLLANTAALLFTATGISGGQSDPLPMSFILQRTSGQ